MKSEDDPDPLKVVPELIADGMKLLTEEKKNEIVADKWERVRARTYPFFEGMLVSLLKCHERFRSDAVNERQQMQNDIVTILEIMHKRFEHQGEIKRDIQ